MAVAILPILEFEDKILETTGSGKSTQLPQILHRRGYAKSGMIAVTPPHRVAAVSVARRVVQELNVQLGEEVGYAIRFEDRTTEKKTKIKYLTDGVLLRESLSDPELKQYSVIILDEAHERSLNTDILLGLVKRLVKMRSDNLKVLITSATLDGAAVSEFFSNCPVLTVPGKLFPVDIMYSSERPTSYLDACLNKALDIHIHQPPGDVLIFMTGQDDIDKCVKKLEERIQSLEKGCCMDAIILPLHGSLPPEMQMRVFSPPPQNCRRFKVQANQRAGRAGRTRPGKCYRLYTSDIYKEGFTVPEIQRSSLAGSVLYLKSLGLPGMDVLKFDFLDPPTRDSLEDALKQLYLIGAVDESGAITQIGRTMSELPLEPALSRTLIEANEYGCLSQALTVVAMLSAETCLLSTQSKVIDKKRKHAHSVLPDGSGWGDHIQLLQVYEDWDRANYDPRWCADNDLQVRGMIFTKDVRKQLSQIMQKVAKWPMDVQTKPRQQETQQDYKNLRRALSRMIYHNGYKTLGFKQQLVKVHPSSVLKAEEDGMLPNYVVYHELIATSRPFMRSVCAVEISWVEPILQKLRKVDVNKLSGGFATPKDTLQGHCVSDLPNKVAEDRKSKILAARERYFSR
ncbi:hypothetical protein MKW98_022628 [Papaver atlanticum]|uniref:RNA helicase n=1 Tax=Papaver atlanticum TaxID=357466 RepID=A0AAD4XF47_9MAGN|nr:hypothetical protein MKW98_022628 [Papaver atlanticum]